MTRSLNNSYLKSFLYCSDVDSNTVLLIIASFTLYIGMIHFCNLLVFYCLLTAIPYLGLICTYIIGGILIMLGVSLRSRALIVTSFWVLILSLILNIVYVVGVHLAQECICLEMTWIIDDVLYHLAVVLEYVVLGLIAGVNFVITLYFVLLLSDYLSQASEESSLSNETVELT